MESSPKLVDHGNIHLESRTLKAVFSKRTGALINLTHKQTGWHIQSRSALGLSFQMIVPLPQRKNNQVLGENQIPTEYDVAEDGKRVTLTWTDLQSEHSGTLPITFIGNISIGEDGLSFEAELENFTPYVIESVSWPYIGDVSMPQQSSELNRMNLVVHGDMEQEQLSPRFPTGHDDASTWRGLAASSESFHPVSSGWPGEASGH